MISEGGKVTYAGDTDPFNVVGSLGRVVSLSGTGAHVQWLTGPKTGQFDYVETFELVQPGAAHEASMEAAFDNTLDMPATEGISVRACYDETGEEGLVTALNESGHLAMLADYVDEAVGHLATRIRTDPTLGDVLSQLETDEADSLVGRVASLLLNDRLGVGD